MNFTLDTFFGDNKRRFCAEVQVRVEQDRDIYLDVEMDLIDDPDKPTDKATSKLTLVEAESLAQALRLAIDHVKRIGEKK